MHPYRWGHRLNLLHRIAFQIHFNYNFIFRTTYIYLKHVVPKHIPFRHVEEAKRLKRLAPLLNFEYNDALSVLHDASNSPKKRC
jgi:hypothetical protein